MMLFTPRSIPAERFPFGVLGTLTHLSPSSFFFDCKTHVSIPFSPNGVISDF